MGDLSAFVRYRRPLIWAAHALAIPVAYVAAFALRFDLRIPAEYVGTIAVTLPILLVTRMLVLHASGVFRGYFRFFGLHDAARVALALAASTIVFVAVVAVLGLHVHVPRSVYLIDWAVSLLFYGTMLGGARELRRRSFYADAAGRRTIIVGCGAAAGQLLAQIRQGGDRARLVPVGLVDDAPKKHGRHMYGVRVLGSTADLPALVQRMEAQLIVIAIPSATREQRRRIVDQCIAARVEFKSVPGLDELLDGQVQLGQLRDVRIEDLLGRDAVALDLEPVRRSIAGRTVLVTGGAGSIGSELARQVAALAPRRLVLFEQAESPLYFIHNELRTAHPELDVQPVIGSVADAARVDEVFAAERPAVVLHAAAYKHVPLMEENVVEAVRNNVTGTMNVAQAAARHGAGRFVLISTDKAVNPSSVMGATKRVAERVVLGTSAAAAAQTDFRAVRFGNVLGSNGSVVPLFQRQLAEGRALTVTHPDVTRYFMTIPEAVALVQLLPRAQGRRAARAARPGARVCGAASCRRRRHAHPGRRAGSPVAAGSPAVIAQRLVSGPCRRCPRRTDPGSGALYPFWSGW